MAARSTAQTPSPVLRITGARPGAEFRITCKPANAASATFVAVHAGDIVVSRHLRDILALPDATPVVANWHGQYRTDAFALTVADLRAAAAAWERDNPPPPPARRAKAA